jgi:hypothetical protein
MKHTNFAVEALITLLAVIGLCGSIAVIGLAIIGIVSGDISVMISIVALLLVTSGLLASSRLLS